MIHNPLFLAALAHLSKFLGIANRFIPIYRDIKPVAQHIPEYLNRLASLSTQIKKNGNNYVDNANKISNAYKDSHQPQFFQ